MEGRKLNKKRLFKALILLILITLTLVLLIIGIKGMFKKDKTTTSYIAANTATIKLYDANFEESGTIPRGTKVESYKNKVKSENGKEYQKISINKRIYLVSPDNIVDNEDKVVLESEMYVRTHTTVYKDFEGSILGNLKKGDKVEIVSYDKLNEGIVNMYKIKYNNEEGYVYAKYLVNTKEQSLVNYDEEGVYKKHLNRDDYLKLGGGDAGTLDYFPYPKASFEDNVMPEEVRTLYLNGYSTTLANVDKYIELAKKSNINAFVVDIKDGYMSYESEVAKHFSTSNYKSATNKLETYKKVIQKIKDNGFYVIGRISVFKDSLYAKDNPSKAITAPNGILITHNGAYWPSAFQRDVWEFNVGIAKEAVKEFGFNEIQFDYCRFPDNIYGKEKRGEIDLKNNYNETKAQAIQGFLFYATDEIHKLGAYVSVDVFGESAYTYVTGYGQYWAAMSNIVDVISAMPYPDHFNTHDFGISEVVWTVPYKIINAWAERAALRQQECPTPAKVRTWVQAYNAIRDPYNTYGPEEVSAQIRALYENGLDDGYITWNSVSSLDKYNALAPAFKKNYR